MKALKTRKAEIASFCRDCWCQILMSMKWAKATDLGISHLHTSSLSLRPAVRSGDEESVIVVAGLQRGDDRKVLEVHYHAWLRNTKLLY